MPQPIQFGDRVVHQTGFGKDLYCGEINLGEVEWLIIGLDLFDRKELFSVLLQYFFQNSHSLYLLLDSALLFIFRTNTVI